MRVLVTGGNGYIGGHVLGELIERGHDVVNLDIADPGPVAATVADEVSHVRGDVTDPVDVYDAVAAHDPDRIIHLAGLLGRPSREDPRRAFEVNVTGTFHVLEAAGALGVERVAAAATINVYGRGPPDADRIDEATVRQPINTYGFTKYAVEWIGGCYDVDFAALEPVHGFGPDRRRGNVDDALILKAAVAGEPLTVPRIDEPIEYVYVEDTARAFLAAALADETNHDTYIVGTDQHASIVDLVELIRERVSGADLEFVPRGDDEIIAHPPTDTARIRADLGWEPRYTVEEMIDDYATWLESNPEAWTFDRADVHWE